MSKKEFQLPKIAIWWPDLPSHWHAWLPSRGNVLFTLLLVSGLLWASSVGALPLRMPSAAGTSTGTIAYQGRLADSAGNPITTHGVAMQFRLYDVDIGGAPLWEETQAAVPVEDGLFSVLLGSITPIPVSLLANHSNLWLGITVGSDSEMSPRELLTSVPFALYARSADVADGAITTAKLADGAVTSAKIQDGQVGNGDLADNAVTSTKIQDRQVGNVDLTDNAVTSSKIQDGQVGNADLADDAVTNAKLAPESVTQIEAPTLLQTHPTNGNNGKYWRFEVGEVSVGPVDSGSQGSADVAFNQGFVSTPKVFVVIHNATDVNWTQSIAVVELPSLNGFKATVNNQSGRTQTYSVSWIAFGN